MLIKFTRPGRYKSGSATLSVKSGDVVNVSERNAEHYIKASCATVSNEKMKKPRPKSVKESMDAREAEAKEQGNGSSGSVA